MDYKGSVKRSFGVSFVGNRTSCETSDRVVDDFKNTHMTSPLSPKRMADDLAAFNGRYSTVVCVRDNTYASDIAC